MASAACGLEIRAVEGAQDAEEDLAGIGGKDEAQRDAAGKKAVELDRAGGARALAQQVQDPLAAEIDDEQGQQLRHAAKDAGEGGRRFVQPGTPRMGWRKASARPPINPSGSAAEGEKQGVGEPERELVTPAIGPNCRVASLSHKASQRLSAGRCFGSAKREGEIFVVQRLVGSVVQDLLETGVERVQELRVAQARR